MTIKLPKDFFFGAAMSGPQTEGAWNDLYFCLYYVYLPWFP